MNISKVRFGGIIYAALRRYASAACDEELRIGGTDRAIKNQYSNLIAQKTRR